MKFIKYFFFIIMFITLNTNLAISDDKIAFINLDSVIQKTVIGKKTLNKIESLNSANIKLLKQKENELKNNEDEIKKKKKYYFTRRT